jgi:lipopolysaccharide biosynthesis glycosyltransferase
MKADIVFSLNQNILVGLLTAMNATVRNTAYPERLRFNILVPPQEMAAFEQQISEFFPAPSFEWRLGAFTPPQFLKDYVQNKFGNTSEARRISRYMQYAPFFLKDIFSDVEKGLYLDGDVLVLGDVCTLFDTVKFTRDRYFAAVPHFFPAIFYFSNPIKAWQEIKAFKQPFNGGVFFIDYGTWGEAALQRLRHYLDWDAAHNYRIMNLAVEPLLNVAFKDYIPLDRSWNQCGYGNVRLIAWLLKKDPRKINIIHWSGGHHKPWKTRNIVYGNLWRQYAPKALLPAELQ